MRKILFLSAVFVSLGFVQIVTAQSSAFVSQLAYDANNDIVALGMTALEIELRDLYTNNLLGVIVPSEKVERSSVHYIRTMEFSPDGQYLAVNYQIFPRDVLEVYSLVDGKAVLSTWVGDYVGALAWSPDSRYLAEKGASGLSDLLSHRLQIWDVQSREIIFMHYGTNRNTRGLDWHPDGTRLLDLDRFYAVVWDTTTWEQIGLKIERPDLPYDYRAEGNTFYWDTVWNHDGSQIFAISGMGDIYAWDSETYLLTTTLQTGCCRERRTTNVEMDVNATGYIVLDSWRSVIIADMQNEIYEEILLDSSVSDVVWINDTEFIYARESTFVIRTCNICVDEILTE